MKLTTNVPEIKLLTDKLNESKFVSIVYYQLFFAHTQLGRLYIPDSLHRHPIIRTITPKLKPIYIT